jgi:hypothetical protein
MLKTLKHWSSTPVILVASYFVLDHLLPDMFKIPHVVAVPLTVLAGTLFFGAHSVIWWRALRARVPGPWFTVPVWHFLYWIRRRPTLQIILAAASQSIEDGVVDECRFKLTVWRNVYNTLEPTVFRFDRAILEMRSEGASDRPFCFRPVESGGLLLLPVQPGRSDAIALDFALVSIPLHISEAPNFITDYEIELKGVVAETGGARCIAGTLAPAHFQFSVESYRINNNAVLVNQL